MVLLAVVSGTASLPNSGFAELSDGRGGTNVESATFTAEMGFDKKRSLEAFQTTLYPLLRAHCSACLPPPLPRPVGGWARATSAPIRRNAATVEKSLHLGALYYAVGQAETTRYKTATADVRSCDLLTLANPAVQEN